VSFNNGETVIAQTLRLGNPGEILLAVAIKMWLGVPGGPPIGVVNVGADGSVQMPAGFDQNFGPVPLFTVTPALPRGNYEFSCRLFHPVTFEQFAEDLNPFTIP
jgi:hypothetical protein